MIALVLACREGDRRGRRGEMRFVLAQEGRDGHGGSGQGGHGTEKMTACYGLSRIGGIRRGLGEADIGSARSSLHRNGQPGVAWQGMLGSGMADTGPD